jgi:hypothetical protein
MSCSDHPEDGEVQVELTGLFAERGTDAEDVLEEHGLNRARVVERLVLIDGCRDGEGRAF